MPRLQHITELIQLEALIVGTQRTLCVDNEVFMPELVYKLIFTRMRHLRTLRLLNAKVGEFSLRTASLPLR